MKQRRGSKVVASRVPAAAAPTNKEQMREGENNYQFALIISMPRAGLFVSGAAEATDKFRA